MSFFLIIFKFPFISFSIFVIINSKTILYIFKKLSFISISIKIIIHTSSFFNIINKFPIIFIPIIISDYHSSIFSYIFVFIYSNSNFSFNCFFSVHLSFTSNFFLFFFWNFKKFMTKIFIPTHSIIWLNNQ